MRTFAVAMLTAGLLAPALSMAGDQSIHSTPKPASFVPRPHSGRHVYGSPIGRPVAGRVKKKSPPIR